MCRENKMRKIMRNVILDFCIQNVKSKINCLENDKNTYKILFALFRLNRGTKNTAEQGFDS